MITKVKTYIKQENDKKYLHYSFVCDNIDETFSNIRYLTTEDMFMTMWQKNNEAEMRKEI